MLNKLMAFNIFKYINTNSFLQKIYNIALNKEKNVFKQKKNSFDLNSVTLLCFGIFKAKKVQYSG